MAWIGIDIGGTFIKGGLVDNGGNVLNSARSRSERFELPRLVDRIAELVGELRGEGNIQGVGLGVPGLISHSGVRQSPNMPALAGADVADLVSQRTGLEAVAANDADMAAWGEFRAGAGRGSRHMIAITIGTGLGSGIIVDGILHRGADGYGAEAGHIVVEPDGEPCGCGGHGCLETRVSETAIVRQARDLAPPPPKSAREVSERAASGDSVAREILAQTGRFLGIGLATLANLFNPERIVIGGGVSAAGDLLLEPASAEFRARAYTVLTDRCPLVPAALGTTAGVVGAALYAMGRPTG